MATVEQLRALCETLHASGKPVTGPLVRQAFGKGAGSLTKVAPVVAEFKREVALRTARSAAAPDAMTSETAPVLAMLWAIATRHAVRTVADRREEVERLKEAVDQELAAAAQHADDMERRAGEARTALGTMERRLEAAMARATAAEAEAGRWRVTAATLRDQLGERAAELAAMTREIGRLSALVRRREHGEIMSTQRKAGLGVIDAVRRVLADRPEGLTTAQIHAAMDDDLGLTVGKLRKRLRARLGRDKGLVEVERDRFALAGP